MTFSGNPSKYIAFILVCAALVLLHLSSHPYAFDDAYIHLRIARNFVESGVPYYNLREPVMGTSSPLWTLLVSLIFRIFGFEPWLIAILNGTVTSCAAIIWTELLYKDRRSKRIWKAWALVSFTALLWQSSSGLMETPLALLLLGLSLYLYRSYPKLSCLLLALAAATRIELLSALLIIIGFRVYKSELKFSHAVSIIGGLAPIVIFSLYYYDTVIPHPVLAKSIVYELTTKEFINLLFTQILGEELSVRLPKLAPLFLIAIVVLLVIAISKRAASDHKLSRLHWILLAISISILGVYAVSKALIFPWYVPLFLLPLYFTLLSTGLNKNWWPILTLSFILVGPSFFGFALDSLSLIINKTPQTNLQQGRRVIAYRDIGREIYKKDPNARIMSPEIGGLGYEFRGEVTDALGLVSPLALPHHPLSVPTDRESGLIGAIPPQLVEKVKPDYIVALDIFTKALLESSISESYDLFYRTLEGRDYKLWKSDRVVIFVKK